MEDNQAIVRSSFDLKDVAQTHRGKRWHEAQNRFFFRHENGTVPEFSAGQFNGVETRDIRVATFGSDPTFCERTTSHVAKDTMDTYFIVAPTQGKITLVQNGRDVELDPGSFSFVSIGGLHEYLQPTWAETHGILIPGPVARALRPDINDHTARDFKSTGALQAIYSDFIDSLCRNSAGLDVKAFKRTSLQLTDMLSLLIDGVDLTSSETTVQIMHRRRAMDIVENGFRRPEFDIGTLVSSLGLSERYIQKLFSANDETFSIVLRKRRLTEACRLLEARQSSRASIGAIAYQVGFSDPAYFSRVFRKHMGVSPIDWIVRSA